MFKRSVLTLLITFVHFVSVQNKCTNEAYGLYCTDLSNEDDNNDWIVFKINDTIPDDQFRAIFLKHSSGKIVEESFSLFPKVKSLDIQYCEIDSFSTGEINLQNLYLINNKKFPVLTKEFLKTCCGYVMTLYIFDNEELEIEDGCFTGMDHLNHLTFNKQNIQNLTKELLEGLNEVTYLNLKGNNIETVSEDAFEDLPNLSYLILNDNNISKFDDDTFVNLTGLESFEFLRLNLEGFNISILANQKELKNVALPTSLIKDNLVLGDLTAVFKKLETIVLSEADKDDEDINNFILNCEDAGFTVKFG